MSEIVADSEDRGPERPRTIIGRYLAHRGVIIIKETREIGALKCEQGKKVAAETLMLATARGSQEQLGKTFGIRLESPCDDGGTQSAVLDYDETEEFCNAIQFLYEAALRLAPLKTDHTEATFSDQGHDQDRLLPVHRAAAAGLHPARGPRRFLLLPGRLAPLVQEADRGRPLLSRPQGGRRPAAPAGSRLRSAIRTADPDAGAARPRCPPTSRPLSRWRIRVARWAAWGSWVTMTIVLWNSRLSDPSRLRISSALLRSRSPVGSSATIR